MSRFDPKQQERMFELVDDRAQAYIAMLDREVPDRTIDTGPVDDEAYVAWFEEQIAAWPPELIIRPDGTIALVSPYIEMLIQKRHDGTPLVRDGEKWLRRYERLVGLGDRRVNAMMNGGRDG